MAVGVGDVLEFVPESPRARARRIEELKSRLEIEIKIKLRAAGNVDGDRSDRCDESGRGSAVKLQAVLAEEIEFQAEGIDAAAIDRFVAGLAETLGKIVWIRVAGDVGGLMHDFDGNYIERVGQRNRGPIVDRMAVAEGDDTELAVAGDANRVSGAEGIAAPDAEFGVALGAG